MLKPKKMPSKHAITNYWVVNMPEHLNECGESVNEKQCWACGDTLKIERCHITPRCDGGSDTVENLHLLCSRCHVSSEFLRGDSYWDWLENKYNLDFDMGLKRMLPIIRPIIEFAEKQGISCHKEAFSKYMEQRNA